jgi:putative endopeptidase
MPDDKSRYGTFDQLADLGEEQLKVLFDEIAKGTYPEGSIEQKIADFYNSGMDTAAIEAAGIEPLKPFFEQVDGLTSTNGLQKLVADWHQMHINPMFGIYATSDEKNSEMVVAYLSQGGLGMPDRDYYMKDDERTKEIQEQYRLYLEKLFTLIGETSESAKTLASTVYNLEAKMAAVSMTRLEQRDPHKTYNKMNLDGLTKRAPVTIGKLISKKLVWAIRRICCSATRIFCWFSQAG